MTNFFRLVKAALTSIMLAGLGAAAAAEEHAVSGTVTYLITPLSTAPAANGGKFMQNQLKGVILSNDSSSALHLGAHDCSGTSLYDAKDMLVQGAGSCSAVDADGDIWWSWYHNTSTERRWTVIGGTGKYAGMTGKGTVTVLGASPDGRLVISWQGTSSIK